MCDFQSEAKEQANEEDPSSNGNQFYNIIHYQQVNCGFPISLAQLKEESTPKSEIVTSIHTTEEEEKKVSAEQSSLELRTQGRKIIIVVIKVIFLYAKEQQKFTQPSTSLARVQKW